MIINVIYYYLAIRLILIVLYERILIVNWGRISLHYLSIILISNIIYNNFINSLDTLLPDFSQIKNEIWLLIILFIYQVGNGIEERLPNNQISETSKAYLPEIKKRKRKYILRKYSALNQEYGKYIGSLSKDNDSFRLIILSILIYENFNRPRIIRFIERVWVQITKKETTQGIMQISSDKPLDELKSVEKEKKSGEE